jgi:hypothetical protein
MSALPMIGSALFVSLHDQQSTKKAPNGVGRFPV